MKATRSVRSDTYTLVPQTVSDEDEGVFEESPESSQQHSELLPADSNEFGRTSCSSPDHHELTNFVSKSHDVDLHSPTFEPIVHSGIKSMSPARKCCFVASLFACVAYVVALIWLIPCHLMPCHHRLTNHKTNPLLKEWDISLPSLGGLSEPTPVVISPDGESVIIFAFQLIEQNASTTKPDKNLEPACGVLALSGTNGREVWRQLFYTHVEDVVCDLTDVNQDGIFDCTIVGSTGLLAAINASNGHTFWYLHNHDERPLLSDRVSSPCSIRDADLNGDGVRDLLVLGTISTDFSTHDAKTPDSHLAQLLLISGASGEIIGQPVPCPYSPFQNKLSTPIITQLSNPSQVLLTSGSCKNTTNNYNSVMIFNLNSFISKATEDLLFQLNTTNEAVNDAFKLLFSELCIKEEILKVIVDDEDILLLTKNVDQQTMLFKYQYHDKFILKWRYQKEDYSISDISTGKLDSKIVVTTLKSTGCATTCHALVIVLDAKDGKELQSITNNCYASKVSVLRQESTSVFLFESAHANNVNNSFNTSLNVLSNTNHLLELNLSIDLQQQTTCNDTERKNTYKVVQDSGFVIVASKQRDQISIRTISIRSRLAEKAKSFANLAIHPNLT